MQLKIPILDPLRIQRHHEPGPKSEPTMPAALVKLAGLFTPLEVAIVSYGDKKPAVQDLIDRCS